MRDPFVAALDALFRAPGSAAAVYTGTDGMAVPIRVIVSQPDQERALGRGKIVQAGLALQIRVSDVAAPRVNDRVELLGSTLGRVGSGRFRLYGEPLLDAEGLEWTCPTEPAP